ncbi:hypothetical protein DFP72DRAFT_884106 [Ephemerocybe angulata]|uniref:F-box domain-containing protein n=1 Tax=Ephemerocybe angulata TaxID=980116 RepID=A0A8H6I8I4_9AGAR|nr:hypothetical protein DFP72DRAFT_884106 [Tulosesus angulatus]
MLSKRVKSFFNLILGVSGSSADSEEPLEPCSLGASQASSRLLNLPFELIHKILFSYHYSSRDYCVLRLVCSGLNGLVKHRIAGHLRLPNKTASEAKWETLTSRRKSVFSTATHTLYLKGFEEDRRKQVGCRAYSFNAALHNAQMKYLCASIAVLKRVKTVHWTISTRLKMNHDILKCLTQLPHLENIHFAVDRNPKVRQMQYPWGLVIGHSFLNLKSVSLDIYSRDQVTGFQGFGVDAMSSDIHLFLSAHPTLESLDLTGPPHANVDFSDILQDIPTKEGFRASITSLRLRDMNLDATPGVLLYLSQLTSLDISNKADLDKGKIWVGLRDARVKLQVLKVSHIPQSLLSYLSSYTGLREFHGIVWHRPDSDLRIPPKRTDVEARDRLFQTVLPFHRDSLEAICVSAPLYSDNEEDARYWCATETQMMQLQRFPGLKALGLAYLLEWDHDGKPTVKPGSLTMRNSAPSSSARSQPNDTAMPLELPCTQTSSFRPSIITLPPSGG